MRVRTTLRTIIVSAALSVGCSAAFADAFESAYFANVKAEGSPKFNTVIRGRCDDKSHIAVGTVGADLGNNRTPFRCDVAILTEFDNYHKHVMITFATRASTRGTVSFSGLMDIKDNILTAQKVYVEPGKPTYIDVSNCKFFFTGQNIKELFCGSKYDADGQRTVTAIGYVADPGE